MSSIATYRNKWEDQKIKKYYIKKHKGVATRQHKFPKLSSNSARPWVRNWAKISKLECRVKHKNQCNDYCNEIKKYSQKLHNEMELTSSNTPQNKAYNEESYDFVTFTKVTLDEYIDTVLSQYDDDYDELLQITIQQSFETYSSETIAEKNTKIDEILPKVNTIKKKHLLKQGNDNEINENELDKTSEIELDNVEVDLKVNIHLHNIFGVNYPDINPKDYTINIHKIWKYSKAFTKETTALYKIATLPYQFKGCNMQIGIDQKTYSFCFDPHRKTEYSVMVDGKDYSFKTTDYEASLMHSDKQIIPIYFEKQNHLYSYSHYNDNRRLFQIAQKCFENIIPQSLIKKYNTFCEPQSLITFCLPQWKYSNIHQQNNIFIPSICKIKDILLEYIPIDILYGILIAYIGYSEFESVTVHSTVNIRNEYKDEWIQYITKNEEECDKASIIKLESGTTNGFKYIEPFSNGSITTFVPSTVEYKYDAVKYDSIDTESYYFDYSKSRYKTCVAVSKPRKKTNKYSCVSRAWDKYWDDGVYDEKQRIKDLKKQKTKGKKRKRRNRKYVIKPKIKHRRRKERKKKYRSNVYHQCTIKQKRVKLKMINKGKYIPYSYAPNYVNEYMNGGYSWYWCDVNYNGWGNKRGRTNKHFAPKTGRKHTRLF